MDEAAEYMNKPEGAFIWLLPGAAERHKRFLDRSLAMTQGPPTEILSEALTLVAKRGVDEMAEVTEPPDSGTDVHFRLDFRMRPASGPPTPAGLVALISAVPSQERF